MRDFVLNLVRAGAMEMYDLHGRVSPWRLTRSIHIGTEVIRGALLELGYFEQDQGNFVLKKDQGKAKVKKPECLAEPDLSVKISNDIKLPTRDFIWQNRKEDYTAYSIHELRSIASNKGIEVPLSMTKGELIKKLKSNLK